jgi:hypothetical protein
MDFSCHKEIRFFPISRSSVLKPAQEVNASVSWMGRPILLAHYPYGLGASADGKGDLLYRGREMELFKNTLLLSRKYGIRRIL